MRIFSILVVGLILLGSMGCSKRDETPKIEEAEKVEVSSQKAEDLVCGMQVEKADAVTAEYQGKTYYFCSAGCRERFLKEPEKYVGKE